MKNILENMPFHMGRGCGGGFFKRANLTGKTYLPRAENKLSGLAQHTEDFDKKAGLKTCNKTRANCENHFHHFAIHMRRKEHKTYINNIK